MSSAPRPRTAGHCPGQIRVTGRGRGGSSAEHAGFVTSGLPLRRYQSCTASSHVGSTPDTRLGLGLGFFLQEQIQLQLHGTVSVPRTEQSAPQAEPRLTPRYSHGHLPAPPHPVPQRQRPPAVPTARCTFPSRGSSGGEQRSRIRPPHPPPHRRPGPRVTLRAQIAPSTGPSPGPGQPQRLLGPGRAGTRPNPTEQLGPAGLPPPPTACPRPANPAGPASPALPRAHRARHPPATFVTSGRGAKRRSPSRAAPQTLPVAVAATARGPHGGDNDGSASRGCGSASPGLARPHRARARAPPAARRPPIGRSAQHRPLPHWLVALVCETRPPDW